MLTPPAPSDSAPARSLESLGPFVKVGSDDTVTVVIKHAEFGQGVTTGLTTIVAEEMDACWGQMRWEFAPADVRLYANSRIGVQGTVSSSSIANSWLQLRQAGAMARAMLVQAAAQAWGVTAEEITVRDGVLSHPGGQRGRFGQFAAVAARLQPPEEVPLKEPHQFRLIGQQLPRLDLREKANGQAVFTVDVQKPGMLVAVVERPPRFGGKVESFDASQTLEVPGVREVVAIPRGVAVVADSFWSACRGRQLLSVQWDESQAETRSSEQLMADFRRLADHQGTVARDDGDALTALEEAERLLEVEYELPYLAHAPMEPMACVAELVDDGIELTYGAQTLTLDQLNVAQALGLEGPHKVVIHSVYGGGSFGRRTTPDSDYVVEAATIVAALRHKAPVKLMWDRTDDLRGGRYRPMSFHRLRGALGPQGRIEAWFHRAVAQSFFAQTVFEPITVHHGVDHAMVHGTADLPYEIPNLRVEAHMAQAGVPTLWWRSLGHTQNAFVTETFFDRLCLEAGQDPIAARRQLLRHSPRHLGVLELALEKSGEVPSGVGRGVAVHKSFDTYVAEVVDVRMEGGKVRVERVVCAVDCGVAVNPDIVKAQMESCILQGLSAAWGEQITLREGRVEQTNFDSYPVLRMADAPPIEVHIVPSAEPPSGVGEPGLPPLAPALANAIASASGRWITRLPLSLEDLV
jgi:isoquinoline 1-oxidoreductase beta subunit